MSELTNTTKFKSLRWQLLATTSVLVLVSVVRGGEHARAAENDSDRPTIWIELGAQMERMDAPEQPFAPPFIFGTPRPGPETVSPLNVGHPPRNSVGGEGKITFEPRGSDWILSVSTRFGRSTASKMLHQQSYPTQQPIPTINSNLPVPFRKAMQFIDVSKKGEESHTILDFQAGKDVGLGMFGSRSSSVISLGLRYAQLGSKGNVAFKSDPDAHPTYVHGYMGRLYFLGGIYHSNMAAASYTRSFRGLGPSLSWNASAPVVGNLDQGQIYVDWGANAAVLFGRQKTFVHHQTTALYHQGFYNFFSHYIQDPRTTLYRHTPPDQRRSHSVTVPNVGGFASLSFRYSDAKLSLGYRADFFFGAMDGGIDTPNRTTIGFYGPFATISAGLP
jgi:iron complex outermembrane receptor protein